ncbi:DNA repair protein Sae2/CtIP [Penicillium atrosanguineum]|uniref:DNA repair protein Sae2/CtIP n=1 Tax=Penicillium atrosanguineum TaxID=1132637 RepID=A0A9W9H4U5_9EURO|nr:mitochondrial carrier protein [Penicillium atrosanguineum]KAJ5126214.1 DNA repair protein Sae2/CtIP [Penicillium atrosanguineum]KAJ5136971.1 DNA repair protein Sae2/CtIP [Penicillium atrosanguineum]KAJ5293305.1 mitochondrial carrier protein [Penicillium atrosanguineum]KAJ5302662.1 DNA repair protein Sae2/CtIP [Penicillium atrosanguineum]
MEILKELHASISEACEASFDNAYKKIDSQIATRDAGLRRAEVDGSAAREAADHKIQELQNHLYVLQRELKRYEVDPKDLELPVGLANLEDEFAPKNIWSNHHDVDQLRRILEYKYTALYTNFQTLAGSYTSLKAKVLQHKKRLQYCDKRLQRDEFTYVLNGKPITFRKVLNVETDATTNSTAPDSRTRPRSEDESTRGSVSGTWPAKSIQNQNTSIHANPKFKFEESNQPIISTTRPEPRHATHDALSSESSSDIIPPLPDLQNRKRKRVVAASPAHPPESAPGRPLLVKSEPVSSSPLQNSAYSHGQYLPSTQDLDEIGDTIQTPTKRNVHREVHREDSSKENELHGASTQRTQPGRPVQQLNVLRPVDGNARKDKFSGQESRAKKQKLTNHRALYSMAEDGDAGEYGGHSRHFPRNTPVIQTRPSQSNVDGQATQDRLRGLLEGSLPSKSLLESARDLYGPENPQGLSRNSSRSPPLTVHSPSSQKPSDDSVTETESQNSQKVRPEDEPYRSLPLNRLNLGHFKINPARNEGLDFAYDAVVRKKDDRKCISGCTRPGCCGDRFRAMARLGGLAANTSAEQAEKDQRILEEYVGEDRHLLDGLGGQDRDNLLVEARARILANQYGRHRHTHQRARSPPGFWRTDMPDTQEIESDREAAQRLEREKVEERYREAMRPGGLWAWADE